MVNIQTVRILSLLTGYLTLFLMFRRAILLVVMLIVLGNLVPNYQVFHTCHIVCHVQDAPFYMTLRSPIVLTGFLCYVINSFKISVFHFHVGSLVYAELIALFGFILHHALGLIKRFYKFARTNLQ